MTFKIILKLKNAHDGMNQIKPFGHKSHPFKVKINIIIDNIDYILAKTNILESLL